MSDRHADGGAQLTCPRCGDEMYAYEDWLLIKPWKRGERTEGSIQGDYVHERCADPADKIALYDVEVTDGF